VYWELYSEYRRLPAIINKAKREIGNGKDKK
jgi:hypothetical protein